MTLPKALKVGNFAVDYFQFSVIISEKECLNWSTIADSDTVVTNTLQKQRFLHLWDTIPFFKIREMQSLFLPQTGTADQAEQALRLYLSLCKGEVLSNHFISSY